MCFFFIALWSLFGCNRHVRPIQAGNISVPHNRTIIWKSQSNFGDKVFTAWANEPIEIATMNSKGNVPRVLLAKLLLKKDISETNDLITKLKVWGVSGSSWALNKKGDYDFTITPLTTILYMFGDQPKLLYPATKNYLLNILLSEAGNKFRYKAPKTFGIFDETENHILMTEGSRYLKNRWIMLHGNSSTKYNNINNGMEGKLLAFLEQIKTGGLYEFNSLPYIGYTITALLNLEAFSSKQVSAAARDVLDYLNWTYALGSYQLKHYPPMRRRYEKASITSLTTDYQSIFMKTWLSYSPDAQFNVNISDREVHALMAACLPYRPADKVIEIIFNKGDGYFVKFGHGKNSSPEIYAAGKEYLLSAGGANRGKSSEIIARPICLFLNDTVGNLSSVIHLAGPGKDFMEWNNTGVYKNFACTAGPVYIPALFKPKRKNETWSIYAPNDSLLIAVHSEIEFGLVAVFETTDVDALLSQLVRANPDVKLLKSEFRFPLGRSLTYDVYAPKNKWVMISDNAQMLNRDFDQWPLMDGDLQ